MDYHRPVEPKVAAFCFLGKWPKQIMCPGSAFLAGARLLWEQQKLKKNVVFGSAFLSFELHCATVVEAACPYIGLPSVTTIAKSDPSISTSNGRISHL